MQTQDIKDTLKERLSRYGTFTDNAQTTQALMAIIQKSPSFPKFTAEHREALHMICHKIARMCSGDPFYIDNVHDIVGYAKLLEDNLIAREHAASPIAKIDGK